jgi:plastocyanin
MVRIQRTESHHPARRIVAMIVALPLAASCGSSTPASPTSNPGAHTLPSTVMIMDTGPTPKELTIGVGATVTFMNHDAVPHGVAGGAEPARPDCPEINAVGVLMPGEIRSTSPFTTAKTCEYHDSRVSSSLFSGRIVIR